MRFDWPVQTNQISHIVLKRIMPHLQLHYIFLAEALSIKSTVIKALPIALLLKRCWKGANACELKKMFELQFQDKYLEYQLEI